MDPAKLERFAKKNAAGQALDRRAFEDLIGAAEVGAEFAAQHGDAGVADRDDLLRVLQRVETLEKLSQNRRAITNILGGAFSGPFLGVTFSLVAVKRAEVGVASTLMALPPVFLLPIGYLLFKERFGWQAVAGTFIAILGVALLFTA